MRRHRFADFPRKVQADEPGVGRLQEIDNTQRLQIVVEAALVGEAGIERGLAGMAERRMAQIVRQCDRLDEIFVQAELSSYRAADLRDLERMRKPSAVMIVRGGSEDLSLEHQPAKRAAVDDALPIALIEGAETNAPARDTSGRGSAPATWHTAPARKHRAQDQWGARTCRFRLAGFSNRSFAKSSPKLHITCDE